MGETVEMKASHGETFHQRLMRLGRAKDYAGALALLRTRAPEPTVDAEEVYRIVLGAIADARHAPTLADERAIARTKARAILALPAPGEVERLREAASFAIEAIGTDAQERARQALRAALIEETRDAES